MAALLLDLAPGDEVIVPSFTFVSTANAFVMHGARPVFVDVRPDTLNLDERRLADAIGPRSRAIVPVHYAGVSCAMREILDVAGRHGLTVIEDNAHGMGGDYYGAPLGSFGALAAQSFHNSKNIAAGEGGALVINTPALVERAEILREKGTNRSRFFRGQVDKYTWVDVGSSYLPSELIAAVLVAQLEAFELIQAARERVWRAYDEALRPWAATRGIRVPTVPPGCRPSWHIYYLLLPELGEQERLISHLRERGVQATFHYQALHASPMGRRFGGRTGDCPVAERTTDTIVRLPLHAGLSEDARDRVIDAVLDFR
jgi:dTDP-4-amino-4,6-dideoxygalactose transaminase